MTLVSLSYFTDRKCAIRTIAPEDVPNNPLMTVGKEKITMPNYQGSDLDLTGLWWLRWGNQDDWRLKVYDWSRAEELISFAGGHFEGNSFPMQFLWPAMSKGHWGYSNFIGGRFQMLDHSKHDPEGPFPLYFYNQTNAYFSEENFKLINKNEDEWLRPTTFSEGGSTYTYTLTRIMYADGSLHPKWFDQWVNHMGIFKLTVWGNDDQSVRLCEAIAWFVMPRAAACELCAIFL